MQNNECVNGSGGTVGLRENPSAFRKWMLACPEQARLLKEFEDCFNMNNDDQCNHEQGHATQ